VARAQPVSATVTITASVDQLCILGSPQINSGNATNLGTVSGSTISIANLSDEQDLTTKATNFDVTFSGTCNYGHRLTLSSDRGGLWRNPAGLSSDGFANGVPYSAVVDWASSETTLVANAASEGEIDQILDVADPATGDITVHFHIDQNATNAGSGAPLLAGTYQDIIRLTLGPQ
jgi:hypothetical protein